MIQTKFLKTPSGREIAYYQQSAQHPKQSPGVVFLGGFMSDMCGTKALHLEEWTKNRGLAFLRFDYSGHGASSGRFEDGSIGDWTADAKAALEMLTKGPQVLVGSSMGGWISLLIAREMPQNIAALLTIAAAPDFTEDMMWESFNPKARAQLMEDGSIHLPSKYGNDYTITRHLIEDGRKNLVLRKPLRFSFPVRLLQGSADTDVFPEVALKLFEHIESPDSTVTISKGTDHRFSAPQDLQLLTDTLERLINSLKTSSGAKNRD